MIEKNHVTEASQSLRDTADALDQMSRTRRNQFDDIKTKMANRQREHEERLERERLEEERLKEERLERKRLKEERLERERLERERLERERLENERLKKERLEKERLEEERLEEERLEEERLEGERLERERLEEERLERERLEEERLERERLERERLERERLERERLERERLERERLERERLEEERPKREWFPALQEHRKLKMAGIALGFLFLFQGAIFCKTDKDMSLSLEGSIQGKDPSEGSKGSIQGKETESHMGLRHEEERQGHQAERTGSELERQSEQTGSEQEKGREQTGSEQEKGSEQTGSEQEKGSEQTGSEQEKGSEQTGSEQEKGSEQTGSESIQRETPFVRAALLNVHSMNKNTSTILKLITEMMLDVFFLTETWLKEGNAGNVLEEASPQNFRSFRHVSELIGYRGVAIQFSTGLHGEQIQFVNINSFECVVTDLKHIKWEEPVLSINLYRPPEKTLSTIRNFLKQFQELLDLVSQDYNSIIVTGDFNIWVDDDWRTYVKEFHLFLLINGFDLHPREPTYPSGHTLDLVLTRNVDISDLEVRNDQISDHYTVYFNWRPVQKNKRKKPNKDGKRFKKS